MTVNLVIALDPGRTTGYAVGRIAGDGSPMRVESKQDRLDHLDLFALLETTQPKYVVCESFEFRNRSRAGLDLYSRELIGVTELWVQMRGGMLFMQSAAKGKGYYTNEQLKKNKLYKVSNPHAMDAVRHLLHWYTFDYGYQFNVSGYCPA